MTRQLQPLLQIRHISKAFTPGEPVLNAVNLDVAPGEIVCLLGPSGCGKTTLLRIVAGLEEPDAGQVLYEGRNLARVSVHERGFGLMFQDFALFPHKTVGQNVAFGLRMAGQSKAAVDARVAEMLELVDLGGYADRSIFDLSGGERQRVALARSLAPSPGLLMLDEPLGALDRSLREELMTELRAILKRVGVTALYVTHDQEEAFAVSDRIVVMQRGSVEQIGAPQVIHDRPASEFVARFLGFHNLLPAAVTPADAPGRMRVETALGTIELADMDRAAAAGEPGQALLLIRPEAARFVAGEKGGTVETAGPCESGGRGVGGLTVRGVLDSSSFRGSYYRLTLRAFTPAEPQTPTLPLTFDAPAYRLLAVGERRPMDPATLVPGAELCLALDPTLMTLL